MKQSLSWEANSSSAGQEIPRLFIEPSILHNGSPTQERRHEAKLRYSNEHLTFHLMRTSFNSSVSLFANSDTLDTPLTETGQKKERFKFQFSYTESHWTSNYHFVSFLYLEWNLCQNYYGNFKRYKTLCKVFTFVRLQTQKVSCSLITTRDRFYNLTRGTFYR